MSKREEGTFSRSDFKFDQEKNVYVCPAGKLLTTTGSVSTTTHFVTMLSNATVTHVR
jgi:hypothetical protein